MCELFEKVHVTLTQILSIQQKGGDARSGITLCTMVLREGFSSDKFSLEEKSACRAAVVAALKVALDQSIRNKTFSSLLIEYSELICTVFGFEGTVENESLKWSHVKPILSSLLLSFDMSHQNGTISSLFKALQKVMEFVEKRECIQSEFLSPSFLHGYGKLVAALLDVIRNEKLEGSIRLGAISELSHLVNLSPISSLSVVLPGILSQLARLLTTNDVSADIAVGSCEIFFESLVKGLSDVGEEEPSTSEKREIEGSEEEKKKLEGLMVERNRQWAIETATHAKELITSIVSVLCANRHESVRLCLLSQLFRLDSLEDSFSDSLHSSILDCSLLLSRDDSEKVSSLSTSLYSAFLSSHHSQCSLLLHDRLSDILFRLPTSARQKGDVEGILKQLLSILHCSYGNRALLIGGSIRRSILSVCQSMRIDMKKLLISRMENPSTMCDFLTSIPFQFGISWRLLEEFCGELAHFPLDEILSIYYDLLSEVSPIDRVSVGLLLSLQIVKGEKKSFSLSSHVLFSICELSNENLQSISLQNDVKDDVIEDLSVQHSLHSCLSISALCTLSCSLAAVSDMRSQNILLVDSLCYLLEYTTVHNYAVSLAAQTALEHIATSQNLSVAALLSSKAVLIVNKISLFSRQLSLHPHTPSVFSAFVDRLLDPSVYNHVKEIGLQMMRALDDHNESFTLLLLRSLLSFVDAIARWFPDMRPEEEKFEEVIEDDHLPSTVDDSSTPDINDLPSEGEKKPPPDQIKSVEAVLLRTKHLLSSSHIPIRLLVLRILSSSLTVTRYFEDILLPMVHQNWFSLRNRLRDEQLIVRIEAVKCLVRVCEVSGSFVYRRVKEDAWLEMQIWMRGQTDRVHYSQSETYRLMEVILKSIPCIWLNIGFHSDDSSLVLPLLKECTLSSHLNQHLKDYASEAVEKLEEYLKNGEKGNGTL